MKKILVLLLTVLLILSLTACSQYKEGDYEKVNKKLNNYLLTGKQAEAQVLMEENPWYTVKNKELAQKLMGTYDKYLAYEYSWLPVIARIDESIDAEITAKKNEIFFEEGYHTFNLNDSDVREDLEKTWANCTEGSKGHQYYLAFTKMLDGEYPEGGKLLTDLLNEQEIQRFEEGFFEYHNKTKSSDLEDFMGRMYFAACIANFKPAASIDQFKAPSGDYSQKNEYSKDKELKKGIHEHFKMPEKIRSTLTRELTEKANGNKVLVINKVARLDSNKSDLYIDGYLMRSLPATYCADTIADVGYVILIEYGYLKDGGWYAGTAKATVYDVKNKETIFTSDRHEEFFDTFYYGKPTKYIFSKYPNATNIVKESLVAINETTHN